MPLYIVCTETVICNHINIQTSSNVLSSESSSLACRKLESSTFSAKHFKTLRVLDLAFNLPCYASGTFPDGVFAGFDRLETLSLSLIKANTSSNECSSGYDYL